MPLLRSLLPYAAAMMLGALLASLATSWLISTGALKTAAKGFLDYGTLTKLECVSDKAQAWSEVVNDRASLSGWLDRFDQVLQASDEQRSLFRADLAKQRATALAAREDASAMLRELDNVRTATAMDWKKGRVPSDVTCGVLHVEAACSAVRKAAASAPGEAADKLPGPGATRPPNAGGGSPVPGSGSAAGRPGDGGRK